MSAWSGAEGGMPTDSTLCLPGVLGECAELGVGGAGFLHGASWLHTDREHICCLCNPWLFTGRDKEGSHTKDVPTVAMTVPSPSSLPSANSP